MAVAADVVASPTFTAHATAAGLILGTAAYMAPEQARGRRVDRRADIWAFGVVFFEMLSGTRPFGGETISETLAAIIKDAPSWTALPGGLPIRVRELLKRTLEKDPRRRLRDIGDARLTLEDVQLGAGQAARRRTPNRRPAPRCTLLPWALTAVATSRPWRSDGALHAAASARAAGAQVHAPHHRRLARADGAAAISPDGRHVAFVKGGTLWMRSLDQLEPRHLAGTAGAQFPSGRPTACRSPTSPPTPLARRRGRQSAGPRSLPITSARAAERRAASGLRTTPSSSRQQQPAADCVGAAQGGEFVDYYKRDPKIEGDFHRPSLLPDDNRSCSWSIRLDTGADTIGVLANGTQRHPSNRERDPRLAGVFADWPHPVPPRNDDTGVLGTAFSLDRVEATGPPFLVAPQASFPSVAANGTLVFVEGSVSGLASLAWLDMPPERSRPRTTSNSRQSAFPAIT